MATKQTAATPKRGRGRPAYVKTPEHAEAVERMIATKHTVDDIALALEISEPTLRLHYAKEIKHGAARKALQIQNLLWGNAIEKNQIGAIKTLVDMMRPDAPDDGYKLPDAPTVQKVDEPKVRALGKKEQIMLDAQNPDTTTAMGRLMAERSTLKPGQKPN